MSDSIQVLGDEVLYSGKLIDVVARTLQVTKADAETVYAIEVARRPPGVRILVHDGGRYLLLKEFRSELGRWDYRIAGGKVFETQAHHLAYLATGEDMMHPVSKALINEAREELGIDVRSSRLIRKSSAGATIAWDLYFFEILTYDELPQGPNPEATELLATEWHDHTTVLNMIERGDFSEDRSIGVLLQDMLGRGLLQSGDPSTSIRL
jgi:8-oxo-dGTP pyrophosphatase MutT (NUDIX family)